MRRAHIIFGAGACGLAAAASLKSVPAIAQLNIGVFLKNQVTIVGDDTSGRSYSDGTYATSCNGYYSDGKYWGATGSGKYWIKPGATAFAVYCDMTTAGGGWTLVAKISGSDAVDRWGYDQAIYSDSTTLGDATTLAVADAKSTAYSTLAAQDILIRRLDGTAYVVHRYSAAPVSWGQFLANNWSQCSYPISTAATTLVDDGRDSLIGSALYLHQADGYIPDCTSQERAMLSQFSTHAGWNECGVGNLPSGSGVAYTDAISYPADSAALNADIAGMLEDYAFLVR